MNAIQNESMSWEEDMEVVHEHETEGGLVEVGAVSETKGSVWGVTLDTSSVGYFS
jgi:hypothetical protein